MPELSTIYDYMRAHPRLLGEPILQELSRTSPNRRSSFTRIDGLLRKPFLAQAFAIMGLAQRWQQVRTGVVVANCGTGKTLISLGNPSPQRWKSIHRYLNGAPAPRGEVGTGSAAAKPSTSS
jgi:hypothetical protein